MFVDERLLSGLIGSWVIFGEETIDDIDSNLLVLVKSLFVDELILFIDCLESDRDATEEVKS